MAYPLDVGTNSDKFEYIKSSINWLNQFSGAWLARLWEFIGIFG